MVGGGGSGGGSLGVGAFAELRLRRLRRYRELLHEQAGKLQRAQTVLAKRMIETDKLGEKRKQLASAADVLARREASLGQREAKLSTMKVLALLSVVVTFLAGLSWAVAGHVSPATFVARAVVQVEPGQPNVTEHSLAAWQVFHESIGEDPRLIEFAAERFRQRGIASLGTPGSLSAFLRESSSAQYGSDGSVVLEMQARGRERAARLLETYALSLVAFSEAGRAQREDGLRTSLRGEPTVLDEPVADARPMTAGAILGGSLLGFALFGGVIWSRLARSKEKMDATGFCRRRWLRRSGRRC